MYRGHMDKDNWGGGVRVEGRTECGRWGLCRAGESTGGKLGTTVLKQLKKYSLFQTDKTKKKKKDFIYLFLERG